MQSNNDAYQHIVGYTGPVLIVHGDADRVVDVSYGKKAAEQYQNAEIVTLPGEDHGFSGNGKITAAHLTYDFLRRQMARVLLTNRAIVLH